jgi:hypothetical protein
LKYGKSRHPTVPRIHRGCAPGLQQMVVRIDARRPRVWEYWVHMGMYVDDSRDDITPFCINHLVRKPAIYFRCHAGNELTLDCHVHLPVYLVGRVNDMTVSDNQIIRFFKFHVEILRIGIHISSIIYIGCSHIQHASHASLALCGSCAGTPVRQRHMHPVRPHNIPRRLDWHMGMRQDEPVSRDERCMINYMQYSMCTIRCAIFDVQYSMCNIRCAINGTRCSEVGPK